MNRHRIVAGLGAVVVMSAVIISPVFASSTPRVKFTGTPIKIGLQISLSGALSPGASNAVKFAQARVAAQNAAGGINHHQVQLIVADDTSTAAGALVATQSLISQGVVAIASATSLAEGAASTYGEAQGVPYLFQCVNSAVNADSHAFCVGQTSGGGVPTTSSYGKMLKSIGVSSLAGVAAGAGAISASGAQSTRLTLHAALVCCNISSALLDVSPTTSTVDFTSDALQVKSSGAQAVLFIGPSTQQLNFANGMQQQSPSTKVVLGVSSYDNAYAGAPSFRAGVYQTSWWLPWTSKHSADPAYFATIKKYAPGIYGGYTEQLGYLVADEMISGALKIKGSTYTPATETQGLASLRSWNGGGLLPEPINLSVTPRSTNSHNLQRCIWFEHDVNGVFQVMNSGKAYCGSLEKNS